MKPSHEKNMKRIKNFKILEKIYNQKLLEMLSI